MNVYSADYITQLEQNHNHEQEKGHKTAKSNLCEWKFVRRKIFAVQFRLQREKRTGRYMRFDNKFLNIKCLFLVVKAMLVTIPVDYTVIASLRVN